MNPEPEKLPSAVVINGGHKIVVNRLDGMSEEVTIRLIPLSKLSDYMEKVGDLVPFVELLCNQKPGWGDSLTDDSVYAIDEIGRKLNDFRLGRLLERQAAAVSTVMPIVKKASELTTSLRTQ